jgi:hypothetical protein
LRQSREWRGPVALAEVSEPYEYREHDQEPPEAALQRSVVDVPHHLGGHEPQPRPAHGQLVPASPIGLVVYSSAGYVQWDKAITLAVGAVALAPLGTRVAPAMKPRLLRRCFALVQAGAGLLLAAGR